MVYEALTKSASVTPVATRGNAAPPWEKMREYADQGSATIFTMEDCQDGEEFFDDEGAEVLELVVEFKRLRKASE